MTASNDYLGMPELRLGALYAVKKGDNVYHIANRVFGGIVSVDDIVNINPAIIMLTKNHPQIFTGQNLIIPLNVNPTSYNVFDIQTGQNRTLWKTAYGFGYSKNRFDDVLFNISNYEQTGHQASLAGQLRAAYQFGKRDRRNGYNNINTVSPYFNYPMVYY